MAVTCAHQRRRSKCKECAEQSSARTNAEGGMQERMTTPYGDYCREALCETRSCHGLVTV